MKRFPYLQNKIHTLKRFLCLQQEKARFWSVFIFTKWKNTFSKRILRLQNEKHAFDWALFVFAKTKTTSVMFEKWKNTVLSRFQIKKHAFEAFNFDVCKIKNRVLRRFHVYKMKYTFLRSFCFYKKFIFQGFCMLIKW